LPRRKNAEQNLTPLELEIMNVLWETGAANVQTVQAHLHHRELAYTTVQTMLNVLHRKGKVKRQLKDRAFVYGAVLSRQNAVTQAVGDMLARFFGGSADSLVFKTAVAFVRITALFVPIVIGAMHAPTMKAQSPVAPRFDVASIKPTSQEGPDAQGRGDIRILPGGHLVAEKVLLRYFIQSAFELRPFQILEGPAGITSAHYDIDAKAEGNPTHTQMLIMMRTLLEERFKLKAHHETRQLQIYEVLLAKGGPKLPQPKVGGCVSPSTDRLPPPPGQPAECGRIVMTMSPSGAQMRGGKVSMAELVNILSNILGRPVVDKTGHQGTFDVLLEFTPDETLGGLPIPPPAPPSTGTSPDLHGNIFAAIQEQLGLKLEAARGPVDVLVIDSVERPSAN
jgi:uncharacterized protein (TIGR03435 family)